MKCRRLIAFEHPEQDNVHVHLALVGVYETPENLKKIMRSHGVALKGAGQLSFKTSFKDSARNVVAITDETIPTYLTYMSKGKYDPSYVKDFSEEDISTAKANWVDKKVKSKDRILLDKFTQRLWEKFKDVRDAAFIRRLAFNFAIAEMDGVINAATRKMAIMLKDSYCVSEQIYDTKDLILPFEPIK